MPWEVLSIPLDDLKDRLNRAESRGYRVIQTFPDPRAAGNVVVIAWRRAAGPEDRPPNCPRCGVRIQWTPDGRGGAIMMDTRTMAEHGCDPRPAPTHPPAGRRQ